MFNLPTMMLCTGLMTMSVSIILSYALYYEKRETALRWWCVAMWCVCIGCLLLMFRAEENTFWISIVFGNAAILLGYGFVWLGFATFLGTRIPPLLVPLGAAIWIVTCAMSEEFRNDFNSRAIFLSLIGAVYAALSARFAYRIYQSERLPSARFTYLIYTAHFCTFMARVVLCSIYPVEGAINPSVGTWFSLMMLESFVQAAFSTFIFVLLVRERSERRYRLAAEIDGLTGAATRRHFVERSTAILAAKPKHAALAVLDLDYFKKVNDTYGHLAGDAVLRAFGSHVGKRLEDGMLLGRMGGEEFALLMPDVDEERAEAFLESLRMSVEQATTHFNGNGLKVTTSIGMASIDVAGRLFDHLLAGADHALYVSKEQGRNKVSVFSQAMQLRTVLEKDGGETRVSLRTKRVSRVSVRTKMARDRA
ncbi:GGDEF domain-containing protein [Rhizobium sp. TRM95796]|uniref:GGDEF domain-containing protein n=1 Tax=Rhizobium sp. TRM95796 TaxID=2979862 RepID=UPI0021E791BF|nr:GGDEF domain-containing protein [Rhizobium sp. TRM95796]MCV3765311.1 GGDEF domain-containing protein [Rhizobium sp. TRM95796]